MPGDRIEALRIFYERGIFTWVSLEPTIDIEASLAIVDATHEFVSRADDGRSEHEQVDVGDQICARGEIR